MNRRHQPDIDELLDRAFQAISHGDRETAARLAGQVLAADQFNADAEDLLAAPVDQGEIRRLTIMFADVVDSTVLSTRVEPEVYRTVVGRYQSLVSAAVRRYEGHIASTKGDGLLAVFGHPVAHENDVQRAVQAGLDITRDVARLNEQARRKFGVGIQVRVGIHRGVVYLDIAQDDVYGFAANFTARISGLADPNTVAVSEAVTRLVGHLFELQERPPRPVKGVDGPVPSFLVTAERSSTTYPLGPMVGRQQELAHLHAAWPQAVAGVLTTPGVALRGEAGIGKSRLAAAIAAVARETSAVVLELTGSPLHTDVGLHPVRRLLERRCGIERTSYAAERLRYLGAELERVELDPGSQIPLLAPVLGIAPESGYVAVDADGRILFENIISAVGDYLRAVMRSGPALVLAEDMHWFDEDTIEVVQGLLTSHRGHELIVMTGRDEAPLPTGTLVTEFQLCPLTAQETDELIVALHPGITDRGRRAVRHRCDGVPLYIEEVVAKVRAERSAAEPERVPDTLYEALFARLQSTKEAAEVVEAAATIGSHIDAGLLRAVLTMDEARGTDAIGQLVAGRILVAEGDGWRFRHELLREVAAELSPPSVRRRLHSRVADAIAAAPASNPDWVAAARHYTQAQRYLEAAEACRHASDSARRRGALNEARSHLVAGITQLDHHPPGVERNHVEVAMRLRLGLLIYAAEGVASAAAAAEFERCLELTGVDFTDDMFATLVSLYAYYAMRADLTRVEQLLESLRATLDGRREWFRAYNTAGFGMLAWYRGEFGAAIARLEEAAAARSDDNAPEVDAVWFMPNEGTASIYTHLALARYIVGDLAGAEAELARTARRCDEVDFPQGAFSLGYAKQMEFLIRLEAGQLDQAAAVAGELTALGAQHGFDSLTLVGAAQQATAAALVALADAAEPAALEHHIETLTGYLAMWRQLGAVALITYYDAVLARLLLAAGRLVEARTHIDTGLRLADETGMRFHSAELLRLRARLHDTPQDRADALWVALDLARHQGALVYQLRCAVDLVEYDCPDARAVLATTVDDFPTQSEWPLLAHARTLIG